MQSSKRRNPFSSRGIARTLTTLTAVVLTSLPLAQPVQAQTWVSDWSDEFNWNGGIDPNKWSFDVGGGGWGNNELQYYTNNRWENTRVELFPGSSNGRLILEARRENYGGSSYTSARLKSKRSWTYGRILIRAQLPSGRGLWPALWMLPNTQTYSNVYWPDNGEIDIMEQVGYEANRIHGSVHTRAFNHMIGNGPTNSLIIGNATTAFNLYELEWRPDRLEIFATSNNVRSRILVWERQGRDWTAYPFNHSFFVLMNIAVGGNWGGAQGVDNSIFPRRMEVDYIRAYKLGSTPYSGSPINLPGRIEAENFDNGGEGFAYHDTDTANNGGAYRSTNVDIEPSREDSTHSVGWINPDEWLTYSVNLTRSTNYGFTIRTASPMSGRTFYIEVDDKRVTPDLTVPNTGSWSGWQSVVWTRVWLPAGQHKVRLVSNTGGFNVNWIDMWDAGS